MDHILCFHAYQTIFELKLKALGLKIVQNRINTYKGSCLDSGEHFNLEKAINDILNYYNNQQMHSSTKVLPNRVFYSSLISFCSFLVIAFSILSKALDLSSMDSE